MIRKAEEKDIPEILDLLKQVSKVHSDMRPDLFVAGTTKYSKEELERLLNDKDYYIYVYINEDQVVGYIINIIQETNSHLLVSRRTLYIDDLCVDETVRGLSIGKKLYNHTLDLAKKLSCYNVTLNVWEGNNAKMFYESLGLKVQKTVYETILD